MTQFGRANQTAAERLLAGGGWHSISSIDRVINLLYSALDFNKNVTRCALEDNGMGGCHQRKAPRRGPLRVLAPESEPVASRHPDDLHHLSHLVQNQVGGISSSRSLQTAEQQTPSNVRQAGKPVSIGITTNSGLRALSRTHSKATKNGRRMQSDQQLSKGNGEPKRPAPSPKWLCPGVANTHHTDCPPAIGVGPNTMLRGLGQGLLGCRKQQHGGTRRVRPQRVEGSRS